MTVAEKYEAGNREAAAIILANPERYAGLPLEWAQLWTARADRAAGRGQIERTGLHRSQHRPANNQYSLWSEEE